MRKIRKGFLIVISLCLIWIIVPVQAASGVDLNQNGSITVDYVLVNAEFSLYYVAKMNENITFTPVDEFASYSVQYDHLDTEGYQLLADTLESYVKRDGVTPKCKARTNTKGRIVWKNLKPGMYLVLGSAKVENDITYIPSASLISIPSESSGGDDRNYMPTLTPKYEEYHAGESIDRKVIKVWKDVHSDDRPENIQIQLLKNDEVYEVVTLSEDNNWQYVWKNLSAEYDWTVVEKNVPKGYTVTTSRENQTCVVTNTKTKEKESTAIWWAGQFRYLILALAIAGILILLYKILHKK